MRTLWTDLKYAVRVLWNTPGFTLPTLLTLVLGIGANSAIFTVVNAVLLRPLPFEDSDNIVAVRSKHRTGIFATAMPNFIDWREQNHVFAELSLFDDIEATVTGGQEPEHLAAHMVSPSFFPMLGVTALRGRTFLPEEEQPGRTHVTVLSYELWQRRFGSDPNIVGKSLTLNSADYTVVGVTPPGRQFHGWKIEPPAELWIPVPTDRNLYGRDTAMFLVLGRIKRNVSLGQAQAEMDTIASRLERQYPDTNKGWGIRLAPFTELVIGNARPALLALMCGVAFVLLIACVNVSNLLLSRSVAKQREFALRMALGASRARLISQTLVESALLGLVGGAIGLIMGRSAIHLLLAISPQAVPRVSEIGLDGRVLAYTAVVALLSSVLCGITPAWQTSSLDLNQALREGSWNLGLNRRGNRLRKLFVAAETGLALVLLIGAGLVIKSLLQLQQINPGFTADKTLTMMFSYHDSRYPTRSQRGDFLRRALERISALPGVQSAGAINMLPLSGRDMGFPFRIEGRPVTPDEVPVARWRPITYGYFRSMGIPFVQGEDFTERDRSDARPVAIISRKMARQFWQGENPIGKRILIKFEENRPRTIIGIVEDVRNLGIDVEPNPEMYVPYFQPPPASFSATEAGTSSMYLVIRSAADPMKLASAVGRAVRQVDSQMAVYDVTTMEERLHRSTAHHRMAAFLLSAIASLALVLAVVGVYGVLSYSVAQRSQALAIHMALGATSVDVLKLVLSEATILVGIGVVLGLAAALSLTRLMSALLFAVAPTDPWIYMTATLSLGLVALIASYVPAMRAAGSDPVAALRNH